MYYQHTAFSTNPSPIAQYVYQLAVFVCTDPMADPGWGIWGKCPPPPPHPHPTPLGRKSQPILVIKILNFMSGQDQLSYTTRENVYILLQFHLKPKQTNVKLAVKLLPSTLPSTFVRTKRL